MKQRIGTPTFMPAAEIEFEDGTKMLVAQPQLLPNGGWEMIQSTLPRTEILPRPTDLAAKPLKYPLWTRVCLWAGSALLVGASAVCGLLELMK